MLNSICMQPAHALAHCNDFSQFQFMGSLACLLFWARFLGVGTQKPRCMNQQESKTICFIFGFTFTILFLWFASALCFLCTVIPIAFAWVVSPRKPKSRKWKNRERIGRNSIIRGFSEETVHQDQILDSSLLHCIAFLMREWSHSQKIK